MDKSILYGLDLDSNGEDDIETEYKNIRDNAVSSNETIKEQIQNLTSSDTTSIFSSSSADIQTTDTSIFDQNDDENNTNENRIYANNKSVISSLNNEDDVSIEINDKQSINNMKLQLLAEIDENKTILKDSGVNTDIIPRVTIDDHIDSIEMAHQLSIIRLDSLRFRDLFEEIIIGLSKLIELIFDGNREIFGLNICFENLSLSLRNKLRKMRSQTTKFTSEAFKHSGFGNGSRILLELVPHVFTHITQKKSTSDGTEVKKSIELRKATSDGDHLQEEMLSEIYKS